MKFSRIVISFTLLAFGIPFCHAQLSPVQRKAIILKRVIEKNHFSPRPVDDSFSVDVFYNMIDRLDRRRLLFTAPEFQKLSTYQNKLDDELNGKDWVFLDLLAKTYQTALRRADTVMQKILLGKFDFSIQDSITFSKDKHYQFAQDRVALEARWKRYLKLRMLELAANRGDMPASGKDFERAITEQQDAQKSRLLKIETKALRQFFERTTPFEELMTDMYFDAIASAFDPHTNYLSLRQNEQLRESLSTEGFAFGIELGEDKNAGVTINRVMPGGPAWKSGEIHKGDQIIQLQWEGKETHDATDMDADDVSDIMDEAGPEKRLLLKLKKTNNVVKDVYLRKTKMDNEDNVVKSFVLTGSKKIGYILLPGFYTEWENGSGSSCADDVAREIIKLKREKIDGLLIDLRFNGGGSVQEALGMTGIFINEGPLTGERRTGERPFYSRDPNRGTIYDGPLCILVNGQSASASELLAASLQDYQRAVIVGSDTYGKGTMQQIFMLDTTGRTNQPNAAGPMVKVTGGKFYRLTGFSPQQYGVKVDISMPDAFDALDLREKFVKNALRSDSIPPSALYKPLPPLPLSSLQELSKARIAAHSSFEQIQKMTSLQMAARKKTREVVPLRPAAYFDWIGRRKSELAVLAGIQSTEKAVFTVQNNQADQSLINRDTDAKEVNTTWLKNLADDIYIAETYRIICDLINLQSPSPKN